MKRTQLTKEHFNAFAKLKKKNIKPVKVKFTNCMIKMEK